jgi:hypothetical protein
MSQQLYRGFSPYSFLMMVFLRLVCAVGFVLTFPHYNENPVLIVIVCLLCMAFIIFLGDDQITVYSDRVVQSTNSIAEYFFKLKGTTYAISDIKRMYPEPLRPTGSALEYGVAAVLAATLPKKTSRDKGTKIFVDLSDGRTVTMITGLESGKIKKIIDMVNSLAGTGEKGHKILKR